MWPGIKDLKRSETERIDRIYWSFPTFTIDILDTAFNTIGSYALPEGKYDWNKYFLTKEGLYLAENNSQLDPKHPACVFHLYKVKFE